MTQIIPTRDSLLDSNKLGEKKKIQEDLPSLQTTMQRN
jgi:hypothetical protein